MQIIGRSGIGTGYSVKINVTPLEYKCVLNRKPRGYSQAQGKIHYRVAAFLRGNGEELGVLGKQVRFFGILLAFAYLDIMPFGMTGHTTTQGYCRPIAVPLAGCCSQTSLRIVLFAGWSFQIPATFCHKRV